MQTQNPPTNKTHTCIDTYIHTVHARGCWACRIHSNRNEALYGGVRSLTSTLVLLKNRVDGPVWFRCPKSIVRSPVTCLCLCAFRLPAFCPLNNCVYLLCMRVRACVRVIFLCWCSQVNYVVTPCMMCVRICKSMCVCICISIYIYVYMYFIYIHIYDGI
jgi:hypothetical protein